MWDWRKDCRPVSYSFVDRFAVRRCWRSSRNRPTFISPFEAREERDGEEEEEVEDEVDEEEVEEEEEEEEE
jgi:hypothetical protein